MKILITGNMGYIGPCLVDQLHRSYPDASLIGYDMGYFAHCLTGASVLPETRIDRQYFGDMRAFDPAVLEGVDAVVHLAAISNDPMGNTYEKVTQDINDESSARLARLAKKAGVSRFVFASSCSMYGFAEGGPRKEDDALNPLTAYARSKVATEKVLRELAGNDFVAGAVAARQITILSDGTPWRPLIHIEDMARAMDWAIGREMTNGGTFLAVNTGSNEWNYQVKDLAHAVAKIIPDVSVSINKDAQPDKRSYQVDFGLFRKLAPKHQPKVDLAGAIQGLKDGLEAMGFADGNFRNSQFMRLKVLTHLREHGVLDDQLRWSPRRVGVVGTAA